MRLFRAGLSVTAKQQGGVQEPGQDGPRCGWAQPQWAAREPVGRAPMLAWVVLLLHRFGFDVWFEKINVQLWIN